MIIMTFELLLLFRNLIQFIIVKNLLKNEDFLKVILEINQKNNPGIINFSTIFDDKHFEYNNNVQNNQHDHIISFEWDEHQKEKVDK